LGEYTPLVIVIVSKLGGFVPSGFVGEIGDVVELEGLVELPHPAAKRAIHMAVASVRRVTAMELVNIML
jgi:hypothetical protein